MIADKRTILLVEDDENDFFLVQTAFAKIGISNPLQRVADGDDAINYLAGTGPFADRSIYPLPILILLDIKLPRKSGFEVLSWLRSHDSLFGMIVLIRSSSDHIQDVKKSYRLGANAYWVKPHTFELLLQGLRGLQAFWLQSNRFCDDIRLDAISR
jgi:DNA-binding response OmpR family regulator